VRVVIKTFEVLVWIAAVIAAAMAVYVAFWR
jgi:hypothetical protein